MSRRKEEGRKRKKNLFQWFSLLANGMEKKPKTHFKGKKKDGKLWLNIIQHDSSSLTFFSSSSSSEEPRFVWTGICFERFISLRSNQIKSTGMKRTTSVRKNISRFFRGYVFGREEGIEGNKCWRRTPFTVVGVTLSRTRSPGFKVHKMLSA